ncbi:MAG TPA: AraC family transcriptional regulator [Lachnospiraceae bacterium]|nr:AraC family transcriptional regulator [Lachnospiraceae bacterium]
MSDIIFSIFPNENFVDLGLYQFGWERCEPSHTFGPAARNHYLFHYIISGTGMLYADDASGHTHIHQIKSGQGFMIFPNQVNTYIADNDLPWEYTWVEFDGLRVREALSVTGLSPNAPIYHARSHDMRETMMQEMLYIARHGDMPPFHLIGHLYLFLDALTRSVSPMGLPTSKGGKLRDFYVHEALAFIELNFQNDISVEDIADHCSLNRSYFGKIFKGAVGQTPQEFLLNYRMTKAAELLKLTRLSIGDISKAVGYDNQLHFSRAFKNVFGVSPRVWRNQNQINV